MKNEKTKILMIVEGKKTDERLMKHLLTVYGISLSHQIVSYKTNIYALYNQMFKGGSPEAFDILQLLKSREPDEEKKKIFDIHYSDIILIFDLDPQDPNFSNKKITEMLEFFVESSDMGKLYLNYPMVESFYHMKKIPDEDFNSYIVTLKELEEKKYKERVSKENPLNDYKKFATTREECSIVILQNIKKAELIIGDRANQKQAKLSQVLEAQLEKLKNEKYLYVLCTCAFYIADYNFKLLDD